MGLFVSPVVEFEDPITGTSYDPVGDPTGTAVQAGYAVLGIAMTLLLVNVAQSTVLPELEGLASVVPGVDTGSDGGVRFGDPES